MHTLAGTSLLEVVPLPLKFSVLEEEARGEEFLRPRLLECVHLRRTNSIFGEEGASVTFSL